MLKIGQNYNYCNSQHSRNIAKTKTQEGANYKFKDNFNAKYSANNKNAINFTGNRRYKLIKLTEWSRLNIYDLFKNSLDPYSAMTARVDVAKLFDIQKEKGITPSHAIISLMEKAVNEIPEFKVRQLKNGKIAEYAKIDPAFSIAIKGSELFAPSSVKYTEDSAVFIKKIFNEINRVKNGGKPPNEDLFSPEKGNFYLSCNPWTDFSSMSFARFNNEDAKPCINWGKYTSNGDKIDMAVAIRIHHGFADGIHIGKFFKKLQENINNSTEIFKGFKSIISFLRPKYNSTNCEKEMELIKRHNEISDKKIKLENLPIWGMSYNAKELSDKFISMVNRLESPIYMHCYAGLDVSGMMKNIFLKADKEGKILYQ